MAVMIHFSEQLDKALRVAARAHEKQGQHRKGSDIPYIIHPMSVMLIAGQATDDEDVLIACLLHDVLEDVDSSIYSEADMLRDFGERVLGIVRGVTKNGDLRSWRDCAEDYLHQLEFVAKDESLIVSAADKLHNLTSNVIDYKDTGEELWQRFTTKSADDQLWWYESVLTVLQRRRAPEQLTQQLEDRISEIKSLIVGTADGNA